MAFRHESSLFRRYRAALTRLVTIKLLLRQTDRIPIGDCCVTARTEKTWVPRGLVLALSLLVLSATSGDLGHAFAGGTWHGFETSIVAADGGPAEQKYPDPTSSHVAALLHESSPPAPVCR